MGYGHDWSGGWEVRGNSSAAVKIRFLIVQLLSPSSEQENYLGTTQTAHVIVGIILHLLLFCVIFVRRIKYNCTGKNYP
jgi:hypothetical protein